MLVLLLPLLLLLLVLLMLQPAGTVMIRGPATRLGALQRRAL